MKFTIHLYEGKSAEQLRCGAKRSKNENGRLVCDASRYRETRKALEDPDGGHKLYGLASFCKPCVKGLALLLAVLLVGCQAAGGFGRGAYGLEHEPLRAAMGQRIDRIIEVAKDDVPELRRLLRDANAKDPGVGTGALVQSILLRVALEVATGGAIDVQPAAPPPGPQPAPQPRRKRRRRRMPPRTSTGRFRRRRRK